MYDFCDLLGCYSALRKTIDDDHLEAFREVVQCIVFDKISVWPRGPCRSVFGDRGLLELLGLLRGELATGVRDRLDSIIDVPLFLASLRFGMSQSMQFDYPKFKGKPNHSKQFVLCESPKPESRP